MNMQDEDDFLSPTELKSWLAQEAKDAAKALELRMKDATSFVTAYTNGEISSQEAASRLRQYDDRWGESLPGTMAVEGASDKSILEALDRARQKRASVLRGGNTEL
jgi:hypothetical protein